MLLSKTKLKADIGEVNEFYLLPQNEKLDKNDYEMLVTWTTNGAYHIGIFRASGKKSKAVDIRVKNTKNSKIAVGGCENNRFIAVIDQNKLSCMDVSTSKILYWKIGKSRKLTCVACHKEEVCVATGDTSGRILVWYNLFTESEPAQATYHWHTLPVRCLTFSESGTELYSGADERVLVKWHFNNQYKPMFMPRLPAPISHLSCGPDNTYIAVCTEDNGIRLVDAQLQLKCIVQQLVKMGTCQAGLVAVPSGTITASTGALIMNGRPGHLQFYSPNNQSLLYNVSILTSN